MPKYHTLRQLFEATNGSKEFDTLLSKGLRNLRTPEPLYTPRVYHNTSGRKDLNREFMRRHGHV